MVDLHHADARLHRGAANASVRRDALGRRPDHGTGDDVRQRAHRAHGGSKRRSSSRPRSYARSTSTSNARFPSACGTEATLRDSEALYSSLVENLPVQVLRKDLAGRFQFANRSFCALLGKPLEEIISKTDFDFYPAELAQKYQDDDRRVAESRHLFECIEKNEWYGEIRDVQVMKSPVRDAQGRVVGVQAVFWDVTERVRAEAAMARARKRPKRPTAPRAHSWPT